MGRMSLAHPDQLPLDLRAAEIEREIEARVASRLEAESIAWRFRLIVIETLMMSMLIAAAGLAVGQPAGIVIRATLLIALTCFGTGMVLLGLSAAAAKLLTRFRRWRSR